MTEAAPLSMAQLFQFRLQVVQACVLYNLSVDSGSSLNPAQAAGDYAAVLAYCESVWALTGDPY